MATKIRLQRHGKKKSAFYHIVAADSRAKRDGRFIEKLGTYNPNTNPATIDLEFDRALYWVQVGAVPTDTVKALLSYKGVMLKNHLDKGVAKGALTEAQADTKFEAWIAEKDAKITGKSDSATKVIADAKAASLEAEKAVNDARAAEIAAKNTPEVEEVVEEAAEEVVEAAAEEVVEAAAEETTEAVVEEVVVEAPAAEEAPAVEETPAVEEAKKEEE
ncbi:MAG: small subunit ribosomal protein S16 [Crocinitomix sp.]|jgi:small subunit ribosomal protein S16